MPRKRSRPSKGLGADPFTLGLDAWLLGAEAACVIAQRSAKIALGGAAAQAEAELMVAEKAQAAWELGLALATGGLGMRPETIARRSLAHYSKRVRANRRRLAG
jgi:hypothetical protein